MWKFMSQAHLNLSFDPLSSPSEDEQDRPPVLLTSVIIIASFASLIVSGIFLYTFLWKTSDSYANIINTGMANDQRMEYLKKQEEILSSYKQLENGLYTIPIIDDMEILVREEDGS